MIRTVFYLALSFALLLGAGCTKEPERRATVPVPKLPAGPVELRVVYLVNPRLPQLKDDDLQRVLESARQAVQVHFGKDVSFTRAEVLPIDAFFKHISPKDREELKSWIYDYRNGGDRARLKEAFEKDLRKTGDDLEAMIDYARPFLVQDVTARSFGALTDALIATQLARLEALAKQQASDGRPILDGSPYSEVAYWDVLLAYVKAPYEVIVTNQLIASAEYTINSVHSALRGGITNGFTTSNRTSRLGTTSILSVYPFVSEDPVVSALRDQETYSPEDAARFAGVLLTHELGHQLFHLGHPYGRTACVMSPTPLLRFREWVSRLKPSECPIADNGAMKPGFAKFYEHKE